MKHSVSKLEGALLDAAVALAEGWRKSKDDHTAWWPPPGKTAIPSSITERGIREGYGFRPSSHWQHGGPIIERERIELVAWGTTGSDTAWRASVGPSDDDAAPTATGPTPLIAAMRAYCAAKFGPEVELP